MNKKNVFFTPITLLCGLACAITGIASLVLFGAPLCSINVLRGMNIFPPIWIYNLISTVWYFLIGAAYGAILEANTRRINSGDIETAAHKGGAFLISAFWISIIRHFLLFYAGRLFIALLLSCICALCSLIASIIWRKAYPRVSSVTVLGFTIWQFYNLLLSFSVFLHN